jgi:hypothetical protein
MIRRVAPFLLVVHSALAATFVVPDDHRLVQRANAIVVASALASHTEENGEIVTTMSIEEVIKGAVRQDTIDLREPGAFIPGVPRFADGERYIVFLMRHEGRWHVLDLVLGKFRFATDLRGRDVTLRDEAEIQGWDPDGSPHRERHRLAGEFLQFLRTSARGGPAAQNYFVPADTLVLESAPRRIQSLAVFSATSYTFVISGQLGGRWNVFPSAVGFYSVGTEPGAPAGGVTAINAAMAAWNNDPSSNVNYVYSGADTGAHTSGLSGSDGANTIAFERDLSAWGAPPFQCSGNSYSGTLGLGGITRASGSHAGPNGETFVTTLEGDVEMNRGVANCTVLFNNGDFNSALAHEVGHTLGFRHSDQSRADNPGVPCTSDASLECSNAAIMKAVIPTGFNAALQSWDQHAVAALYPGTGGGAVAPAAPTGVSARATSATRVVVSWNAVSGATRYEVYRKAPGGTFGLVGTSTTTSFTDTVVAGTAYLYRVRAVSAGGSSPDSAADIATAMLFTNDPLARGLVVRAAHLAELRNAVNAVRALAGLTPFSFTDPAAPGVVIKAIHITQLRTALDQALSALGLAAGGYTDPTLKGVAIKAIHFQQIRDRVQ